MNRTSTELNSLLENEINSIQDPITHKICKEALSDSRQGFERGENFEGVKTFISNQLDKKLNRIIGR